MPTILSVRVNLLSIVAFKQRKKQGTKEVFVLNQSDPVYVKNEVVLTGEDITSVDVSEDELFENVIKIKLSPKGTKKLNEATKDKHFPMLVFFVNNKSIQVIHRFYELDDPEGIITIDEDNDFAVALVELIKSGIK